MTRWEQVIRESRGLAPQLAEITGSARLTPRENQPKTQGSPPPTQTRQQVDGHGQKVPRSNLLYRLQVARKQLVTAGWEISPVLGKACSRLLIECCYRLSSFGEPQKCAELMQTGVAGFTNRLSLLLPPQKGSGGQNEVANLPPKGAGKENPGLRILGSTQSYLPDTCIADQMGLG